MDNYDNTRITLDDNMQGAVIKLSDGNPGAVNVLMQLLTTEEVIDPDSVLGPLGTILHLDSHGIYGSRIWMLYKDVCGENLNILVGICRAVQLGILGDSKLDHAIDNNGCGVNIEETMRAVKEQLPDFNLGEDYGS